STISTVVPTRPWSQRARAAATPREGRSAAEAGAAADAEAPLDGEVLLPVLARRPQKQGGEEDREQEHEGAEDDLLRQVHYSTSASGKLRCRLGGTRKFWRCVVRRTALKPWLRSRGGSGSFTSGRTPSMASRLRWKSSLVGLKTRKWRPAAGPGWSSSGRSEKANGLSSVLKSARIGIAEPFR